jgi:hypothetical protein
MSEQTPESTPSVNVDAEQAVVNNAPDGGGVDNNEAPAGSGNEATESSDSGDE